MDHQTHAIRALQADITDAYPKFGEDIVNFLAHADDASVLATTIKFELEAIGQTRLMFPQETP